MKAESSPPQLLLIDDDERYLRTLARGLKLRGFAVETAISPGDALPFLESGWPDLLILDVAMPGMDGISFCRLARAKYSQPILMLTARDELESKVAGLNAGADDYLGKPFDLPELVARIGALLRRTQVGQPRVQTKFTYADVIVDSGAWIAVRGDRDLKLTSTEFRLLEDLIRNADQVVTREELVTRLWGESFGDSNAFDVHVANLRHKLETGGGERLIHTIRGIGYKLGQM